MTFSEIKQLFFLGLGCSLIISIIYAGYLHHKNVRFVLPNERVFVKSRFMENITFKNKCPNVTIGMMKGKWNSRPLTSHEISEIETLLLRTRNQYGIPHTLQREDGICGNVSFPERLWYRALCNPKGSTPCCFANKCVNKSPDECRCPNCYDVRNQFHVEYSTWEPADGRCQVKNFTPAEACGLLKDTKIFFIGNSFIRQIYTAFLLILNSDMNYGALKPNVTADLRRRCKGMYMFTDSKCMDTLPADAALCRSSLLVQYRMFGKIKFARSFHNLVQTDLHTKNTIVFVGIGVHDEFDYTNIFNQFMLPVIQMRTKENATWPQIIWASNHKFGILKSPSASKQSDEKVKIFNTFMERHLRHYGIPIFDTYNMTDGTVSFDGGHYGMGINIMKAKLFLNFLEELKNKIHYHLPVR